MSNDRENNVVDFGAERVRHRASDLSVECPRCHQSNFMRDGRCQHCGLWFQGEAFQFAPSENPVDPKRSGRRKLAWLILGLLATLLGALLVLALLTPST